MDGCPYIALCACVNECTCLFKVPEVLSVQLLNAVLELFGLLDEACGSMQASLDVLDFNTQVLNLSVHTECTKCGIMDISNVVHYNIVCVCACGCV